VTFSDPVVTIVPRLPPAIDGLGDYGLRLAQQLRLEAGFDTTFLVGDSAWAGEAAIDGFAVQQVKAASASALLRQLPSGSSSATVLLHYVGYGYARRGCPVWLVEALERWKDGNSQRQLVTMFHELYAFGPLWTSAFWSSPLQRQLASRLARLSDRCITSNQRYARQLRSLSQGKHSQVPVMPVFSNVGEPHQLLPLVDRPKRLVVFGSRGTRLRVYERSRLALEQTCQRLNIETIYDVGPSLEVAVTALGHIPVKQLGVLPPAKVSTIMSQSAVGFFSYPVEYLAKSGVFAAYCAHKLLPIGAFDSGRDVDGLQGGKHYLLGDRHVEQLDWWLGEAVAENAYAWYRSHRLAEQASTFANCLRFINCA
jgi:hypothetical protein